MIKHKPLPPLDELKRHLYLDATSPSGLRWLVPFSSKLKSGDIAGALTGNHGYWAVRFKYKRYYSHRLIVYIKTGEDPLNKCVDHVSSIKNNLHVRPATTAQNHANRKKIVDSKNQKTSSIYKGVYWEKKSQKWRAQIKSKGITRALGAFRSEAVAALAYNEAARKEWGEYARLNAIE